MLQELPDFPSRPTNTGGGRIYDVRGDVRCIAYFIDDTETLRSAGATEGVIVYVFVERRKVGVWNWARSIDELLAALHTARIALDPDAPRPVALAPGGEPADIQPPFAREIEEHLQPRVRRIDLDI